MQMFKMPFLMAMFKQIKGDSKKYMYTDTGMDSPREVSFLVDPITRAFLIFTLYL